MKKVLQLQGLDCANCAAELEKEISLIDGVTFASLAFVSQKLTVEYESEAVLEKVVFTANHFEEVRVVETPNEGDRYEPKKDNAELEERKKRRLQWLLICVSAVAFALGVVFENAVGGAALIGAYLFYGVAYCTVGYSVWIATVKNVAKGKIFDENFLMAIASVGAFALGEFSEGVLVMLLYQIGETLQAMAVSSSRRSVVELMQLKSDKTTVFKGRERLELSPEEIEVGNILFIKAGEKIPVDGVLIDASASLDTKSLTGEAELRVCKSGEELLSGCINAGNAFTMRATKLYEDSAVGKILDLVENAASGKAKPEKFITRFARWYTPIVCAAALLLAFGAPLISGFVESGTLYFKDFTRWVQSALTFLVVSCPCALIISVPLTYFSGIGVCAKKGILAKGSTYLDTLARAKTVAFDKTGTLTEGDFSVCAVRSVAGVSEEYLLALAAAAEKASSHPIAKAFADIATDFSAQEVCERAGKGLSAKIDGEEVFVGNFALMQEAGIAVTEEESLYTLVYVAKGGEYLGTIEVGDRLRANAKATVSALLGAGIERCVMLTGDNRKRAEKIANEVGVYEVKAELLPDGKLQEAEKLKTYGVLAYVGDGINDAPVMRAADCAFSMGKLGSAAAVEASDFVLISDDLSALAKAVRVARKTRRIVMQNIVFSIAMKTAFMVLGALGVLPLALAVFADVGVMLLAVGNSFRVRKA